MQSKHPTNEKDDQKTLRCMGSLLLSGYELGSSTGYTLVTHELLTSY